MTDSDKTINDFDGRAAIWATATDDVDLAGVVAAALDNGVRMISVLPDAVERVWPWLEGTGVKIMARFYVATHLRGDTMSELTGQINSAFKRGADGAMVFVHLADLPRFVTELHAVRDGLFFNKDLCIGINADEIDTLDWPDLYAELNRINASALVLALPNYTGDKSDWVGRVYAALNAWDFGGQLHFACGQNFIPMDQAASLVTAVRGDVAPRVRFWVHVN